ncbi:xenotropic and polytropic retrovirus receptor 1 [Tetranychus urticae]|uniref:xenotropic and polytropic retrovirus receptor 1 n=1 Tax=Tetranychus urticae TaxID=32264 RepID=UPI00077C042F|nr:xenotropic and polytropic retrovirus receptor 1 [Tetranychus urticae]
MKFAEHLAALITPEWRKQYILYEEMKYMLYSAMERQPSPEVADRDEITRYNKAFDEEFLSFCEKELAKINIFFAEKLAEATRKFSTLKNELNLIKSKFDTFPRRDEDGNFRSIFNAKDFILQKADERHRNRKLRELKLGFSEFYLSLVLLQSYQNLNFTGFVKILKKHDKLLGNDEGLKWRRAHVENAPFHLNKEIHKLIEETENLFTQELEEGHRQRAMKRLRVPPLNDQQSQWTTFKVGFFSGAFVILLAIVLITGVFRDPQNNLTITFRLYRATFLVILFLFLMGINVYGWRTSGVNHVLIFELDPRDHLSEQHIIEIAAILSVLWSTSVISYLYSDYLHIPKIINPLLLVLFMLFFLFNPTDTFQRNARFWFLRIMGRCLAAPFCRVKFADFWLADQMNSMSPIFVDIQYFICFYISVFSSGAIDNWYSSHERCSGGTKVELITRAVLNCLPAWFRFCQCLRRYYDDNRGPFPHLVNAGKYSTTFFVILFSSLTKAYQPNYDESTDNPFFTLWIIALIISSCYTYIWDIKMDWGLFDSSSPSEYPFLREEMVYSSPVFYYFAICEDLILRFGWTLSVSLTEIGVVHADLMVSILAPLEIFRRFIWNFFRLENEHLNNCGEFRAVRDISIAPIDAGDQAKLIKIMDDPDGVTNRKNKPRKSIKINQHYKNSLQSANIKID